MTELSPEQIAETEITVLVGDLLGAIREGLAPAIEELETLRGIARRSRDLWTPHEQANGSTPRWVRENPDTFRVESEELTPAEVQAIYGQKEKSE